MKKLLTLACAMALSLAATAIDFTWGLGENVQGPSGGYLLLDENNKYREQGTLFLYLGTYDSVNNVIDGQLLASQAYSGGEATGTTEQSIAPDMSYVMVLLADSNQSASTSYDQCLVVTGTSGERTEPGFDANSKVITFVNTDSFTASQWKTGVTVVPEPTSGLLMLLGVAALGLKRKRV